MRRLRVPMLAAALAALAATPPAAEARAQAPAEPVRPPYLQRMQNGTTLDWLNGHGTVLGRVRIFRKLEMNPVNYSMTQSEAEREGYGRIGEALRDILLDAATTLGSQPEVLQRFHAAASRQPAEAVVQDKGPLFQVRVRVPLWGEKGLLSHVLPDRQDPEAEGPRTTASFRPAGPPGEGGDGAVVHAAARPARRSDAAPVATGLVIDARSLDPNAPLSPALLPRVLDTQGRVVYGVDAVDLDFAREYGIANYQEGTPKGSTPAPPGREGNDPLQVMAVGAGGALRADILIEPEAADRILAAAQGGSFLKECRVVVVMPASPPHPPSAPPVRRQPAQPPPTPRLPGNQ